MPALICGCAIALDTTIRNRFNSILSFTDINFTKVSEENRIHIDVHCIQITYRR